MGKIDGGVQSSAWWGVTFFVGAQLFPAYIAHNLCVSVFWCLIFEESSPIQSCIARDSQTNITNTHKQSDEARDTRRSRRRTLPSEQAGGSIKLFYRANLFPFSFLSIIKQRKTNFLIKSVPVRSPLSSWQCVAL